MLSVPRRRQSPLPPTVSDYLPIMFQLSPHFSLASVSKSGKWDSQGVFQSSEDGLSPVGRARASQDRCSQKPEAVPGCEGMKMWRKGPWQEAGLAESPGSPKPCLPGCCLGSGQRLPPRPLPHTLDGDPHPHPHPHSGPLSACTYAQAGTELAHPLSQVFPGALPGHYPNTPHNPEREVLDYPHFTDEKIAAEWAQLTSGGLSCKPRSDSRA